MKETQNYSVSQKSREIVAYGSEHETTSSNAISVYKQMPFHFMDLDIGLSIEIFSKFGMDLLVHCDVHLATISCEIFVSL